jgi:hypothetical protein
MTRSAHVTLWYVRDDQMHAQNKQGKKSQEIKVYAFPWLISYTTKPTVCYKRQNSEGR